MTLYGKVTFLQLLTSGLVNMTVTLRGGLGTVILPCSTEQAKPIGSNVSVKVEVEDAE